MGIKDSKKKRRRKEGKREQKEERGEIWINDKYLYLEVVCM
jgi:hypothetical protein